MNVTADSLPAEIDAELARIYSEIADMRNKIAQAEDTIQRIDTSTVETPRAANRRSAALLQITAAQQQLADLRTEAEPLQAAYRAEPWTRYYLVANTGGHVHTSQHCRTCFDTTEFVWLTEQSGQDTITVTSLAGEKSCAECFPNLPEEIMARKTRLEDPAKRKSREERETAAAERLAKKLAKAITPDGSPLRFTANGYTESLATETAAAQWIVRHLGEHQVYNYRLDTDAVGTVLAALAAKRETSVEIEGPWLAVKLAAWIKREERELVKTRTRLGL